MSNPLWEYSLAIYRQDEVAASCLVLQDTFDMDVNLLLYAAWLAQLNRSLSDHHLAELDARVSEWRNQVVKSLRELRRQLRSYPSSASIYSELKCLELRAEQQQQDLMYAFYQSAAELPYGGDSLLANLTRVARLAQPDRSDWDCVIGQLAAQIPQ